MKRDNQDVIDSPDNGEGARFSPDLAELLRLAPETPALFDLTGRTAVVVGGNKGLGQAIALGLGAAGATVTVAGRGPTGLEETVEALDRIGTRGYAVTTDVTEESQVEELRDGALNLMGRIDILVNSQGTTYLGETEDFSVQEWDRVMNVNLRSLFLTARYIAPVINRGTGRIINVSSVRGFQGRGGDLAYAPSKGAVNQLTRSLAIEWGPRGVNVNGIAPVFTLTAVSAPFLADQKKRDWVLGRIPLKRLGELQDVIGPAVFLASDASRFVNGHILPVDGGWLCA